MSRPAQPAPYAGDLPAESTPVTPVGLRREYRDALGRLADGNVLVARDGQRVTQIPLRAGVLSVHLNPGTYRLTAELVDRDGRYFYQTETVTL